MEKWIDALAEAPLFDGIRKEDIAGLLDCMGTRLITVHKGQYIFREGEDPVYMGILLSGGVHILREDYYGNRSIVARIGPGQLFGESYAFSGAATLPVSAVAESDSRIALLDSRRIGTCCGNACDFHSRLINNLLRLVANKNLMLHQKLRVTSRRTTREKLMEYLMTQAKQQGSPEFTIPFDRQELADYLEVDRTGLSVEISRLRREGVLESSKSTFRLL